MCGRVIQYRDLDSYARAVGLRKASPDLPNAPPHYNGAPSQELLVVRREPHSGERRLSLIRWGLIPHWAKDSKIAWKLINARSDTIARTPAFRDAYRERRCLIPVDGFYEWKKIGKVKQPYFIGMKSGEPFTLAGLWENWKDPATGEWTRTFTIVTTGANELVAELHDRMPVIVAADDQERWLNIGEEAPDLLRPFPADLMTMWPVSTRANSPKNDDRSLLDPVELPPPADDQGKAVVERVNEEPSGPANSE
jgi:putative SOS response-associated peptidase YedK